MLKPCTHRVHNESWSHDQIYLQDLAVRQEDAFLREQFSRKEHQLGPNEDVIRSISRWFCQLPISNTIVIFTNVEFAICRSVLESVTKIGERRVQHLVVLVHDLAFDKLAPYSAVLGQGANDLGASYQLRVHGENKYNWSFWSGNGIRCALTSNP